MLIDILRWVAQHICRPITNIAFLMSSNNWIIEAVDVEFRGWHHHNPARSSGRNTQANVSDHQMVIPFENNINATLVMHIQEKAPKSIADREEVGLIAHTLSPGSVLG